MQAKISTPPRRRAFPSPSRTLVPPPALDTPAPLKFPLTSRYLADGTELRPAAVYLRESERDQGKWSFETQYERARDVLLRYGFYVAMVRMDSKSGGKVSRTGYADVAAAVQYGLIEAVGVYMMARWGRRASERLRIGEEFDRLDVDVYDAQRGAPDKPGMIRVVMAGVDEQFLRDLSAKAVDNMPKAAKAGKHAGADPLGYMRVYPQGQAYDRKVTSVMVEHPDYGPAVREIFRRYAAGESTGQLARWLNCGPLRNPKSQSGCWQRGSIARLLRRRVYLGEIEWGRQSKGEWGRYEGPVIHAQGEHPALIDGATFEEVQRRLDAEARVQPLTQRGRTQALLAGFLLCAGCGGTVYFERRGPSQGGRQGSYHCAARHRALSDCREPSITQEVAEQAVLREVARLQRRPWKPEALADVVREDPSADDRRRLRARIALAEVQMQKSVAVVSAVGDISDEAIAAFRADQQAISAQIRAARDALASLPSSPVDGMRAKDVYDRLAATDMAGAIADSVADRDTENLRTLLYLTVNSARIAHRVTSGTAGGTTWARAEVDWTEEVALLVRAGLLVFGPAPEPPAQPSRKERAAARARRYRARKREKEERIG